MVQFVAGVDTHKDSHTIVFLDAVGEPVANLVIPTTIAGFQKAIRVAKKLGDVVWGVEGTGSYGRGLAEALVARQYLVYEVPGSFTKRHLNPNPRTISVYASDGALPNRLQDSIPACPLRR